MTSFRELQIKRSYNSEKDNILEEFYIPVLQKAIDYKRVAGYFSSSSFYLAAQGIAQFVVNGGHMQLIVNIQLSQKDFDEIQSSLNNPEHIIENILLEDLEDIQDACVKDHVAVLGWMIANSYLEIKVGYIKEPITHYDILHQKVGILRDREGNIITFSGSNNESASGWLLNSEKFKVFCNWDAGVEEYIAQDENDFLELWNNSSAKTGVIPFPEAVKKRLIAIAPKNEDDLQTILNKIKKQKSTTDTPQQPGIILRDYQEQAIKDWTDNDYRGLFEMATGTGKTFTAIGAAKELLDQEPQLVIIISCPFLHLIPQWQKSLQALGVDLPSIIASSNDPKWQEKLQGKILDMRLGRLNRFIVLTTHDSISSPRFRETIGELRHPVLIIGDEVHGMGSTSRLQGLLPSYRYRLGLSATPSRYFDDAGTAELFNFFDKTVAKFDLHDAINTINPATSETYLAPYEYYPIFVDLNIGEFDKYIKLSKEIAQLYARPRRTLKDDKMIEHKLRQRADIIKNAESKYTAFRNLIADLNAKNAIKHTLVYCSPEQIQPIQDLLREEKRIVQHRFTSDEDAIRKQSKYGGMTEREHLLKNFDEGAYDVLVAIKCLDEGVDVPSTQTAILMCSTGNPKEYIQRRGRVLRRFPGKEKAIIYDFIIIPDLGGTGIMEEFEKKIVQSQFQRIEEFVEESLNKGDIKRELFKIKVKYKILGAEAHVK